MIFHRVKIDNIVMPGLKKYIARFINYAEIIGIVVTIILLPIDRLPYLHVIPLNLGLLSLLLLSVATVARLWQVVTSRRLNDLRFYFLIGTVLVLPVFGYLFSSLFAIDRPFALHATLILAAVTLRAFCFFVLLKETPALWNIMKKTIYAVTGVVVFFGLFQFFLDVWGASTAVTDLKNCCTSNSTYVFPRVHSTALEPLYFDHFLMIPIWLLTFDFWRNKSSRNNKKLVVLFLAVTVLFILTIARSATVGLIIASIIFCVAAWNKEKFRSFIGYMTKLWLLAIIVAAALIIMSGVASLFIDKTAQYEGRGVNSLSLFGSHAVDFNDGSSQTRYSLWPKSIAYFKESPLVGVGPDNSRIKLDLDNYNSGVDPAKLQPFNNDLIGLVVDTGIVGILSFLPLLITLLYGIYRQFRNSWSHAYAAFTLILIGMLVQSNFFHSLLLTRTWFVIGIFLIVATDFGKKKRKLS